MGGPNFGVVGLDGKRVEEVEEGGRVEREVEKGVEGWKGERGGSVYGTRWPDPVYCLGSRVTPFHTGTPLQCNALASSDLSYKR